MADYEFVEHPAHYGGDGNPYEQVRVVRAWELSYELGRATAHLCRAGKKPGAPRLVDLRKAIEYIKLEIRHWEEQEALTRSYVQEPVITPDMDPRDPRYVAQFSKEPSPRPPSVSAGDMLLPWRVPGPVTVLGEE